MKLKELEQASKIIERIKELDMEIMELDKFAMNLAAFNHDVEIIVKAKNLEQKKKDKVLDSDGSLCSGEKPGSSTFMFMVPWDLSKQPKEKDYDSEYKTETNDRLGLIVIGTILQIKTEERLSLINNLRTFNVSI